MPFVSKAQEKWMFANKPAMAREWASHTTHKGLPARAKKKKAKITINNKLKGALGQMNPDTNKIQINIKKHKGDKAELASTIKHELLHVKHPTMTEKEVYKRSAKTKLSPQEQSKLLAKLRHKKLNYTMGVAKRKFKLGRGETKPGDLIASMNAQKVARTVELPQRPTERTSILGAV